jgi:hypothetical protein
MSVKLGPSRDGKNGEPEAEEIIGTWVGPRPRSRKTEINGRGDSLRWPRDTLYPQKLALTSPTGGGGSVGIVRLRTKSHGGFF